MKKIKHIIFFLLLFSSFKSEGQIEIGLKLGNGISKVNFPNSFGKELYTYSGQLGFYGVLSLSEKIFFQNEILFNQLEGRMKSTINFTGSNGQPIGEGTLLVQTHQSYLSIPFKLGF